ncbi:MAG: hypothetical protein ACRENE_26760 [Polyangiaceae bacterium]
MKSYSLIGVLGAGFAALAFGACTVTSTTNSNGDDAGSTSSSGGGDDSSIDGASSGSSSGSTSSSGSSSGTSSSSGSSGASSEGGEAGATCNVSFSVGAMACDTCVQANCCSQLMMCDSSDAGGGTVDDAGNTECYNTLVCAIQFAATSDAGLTNDDINTCAGVTGDAAASGGAATAIGLLDCAMAHCATECQ